MGCIYGYQNNLNQKWYVGYTKRDIAIRDKEHRSGKENSVLFKAFCKYGYNNFSLHILEDGIIPDLLPVREKYWVHTLNAYHAGYNLTEGGNGSYRHDVETIEKIIHAREGRKHTPETCLKISESKIGEKNPQFGKAPWNKGKTTPEAVRRKQSEAAKKRKSQPHSEETKAKIRASTLGQKRSAQTRRNMSIAHKRRPRKPHSEKTCLKIGEANASPERAIAHKIFFSLPADMPLPEKRKYLRQKFPEKNRSTLNRWCKKFDSESF